MIRVAYWKATDIGPCFVLHRDSRCPLKSCKVHWKYVAYHFRTSRHVHVLLENKKTDVMTLWWVTVWLTVLTSHVLQLFNAWPIVRWLWAQLAEKNIMESCCTTNLVLLICEVLWSDGVVLLLQVADVGDYAVIRRVIEEAFAWRPIDVLICNAGLLRTAYFEDLKLQDINDLMQTNVMGSVYPVHAALPSLKQRSRTHPICIVFVASLASLVKKQKSDHNTCLVTQTNFKTKTL